MLLIWFTLTILKFTYHLCQNLEHSMAFNCGGYSASEGVISHLFTWLSLLKCHEDASYSAFFSLCSRPPLLDLLNCNNIPSIISHTLVSRDGECTQTLPPPHGSIFVELHHQDSVLFLIVIEDCT